MESLNLLIWILLIGIPTLVPPVLIGLAVLVPPLRKRAQHNSTTRWMEILLVGLVAFVICFGLWTFLKAQFDYLSPNIIVYPETPPSPYPNWQTDWMAEKPALVREFWVRALIPPSLRRPCYTSATNICHIAEYVLDLIFFWSPDRRQDENQLYWTLIGLAAFSALIGSAVAWLVTRPGKQKAQEG